MSRILFNHHHHHHPD
ncbi:his operon leader peptide [Affinibrenneria salicis]|uniref:his operon leader peptide n=1 Tax=Affinibrenneria salicis TaxID=2590031 RepID=A0A5J5G3H5_9GAMM|nr:his operon leader peptide [Affinibrenneria salicis]KAA9001388.1 his operon leader peptide [Affinibrenneria salicis]